MRQYSTIQEISIPGNISHEELYCRAQIWWETTHASVCYRGEDLKVYNVYDGRRTPIDGNCSPFGHV